MSLFILQPNSKAEFAYAAPGSPLYLLSALFRTSTRCACSSCLQALIQLESQEVNIRVLCESV